MTRSTHPSWLDKRNGPNIPWRNGTRLTFHRGQHHVNFGSVLAAKWARSRLVSLPRPRKWQDVQTLLLQIKKRIVRLPDGRQAVSTSRGWTLIETIMEGGAA